MAVDAEAVKQAACAFAEDAKKEIPVQKTLLFWVGINLICFSKIFNEDKNG
ncbi:MAG: hypothetical protein LBR10_14130 [Prevotellaceae bacterium]|jgi:hypothetical protein|nr:hypothetical protein [Prevotellaceae bacterium]